MKIPILLFRSLSNKPDMRDWSNQKDWIGLETFQSYNIYLAIYAFDWSGLIIGLITICPTRHNLKPNY